MLRGLEHRHRRVVDVLEPPFRVMHHQRLAEAVENGAIERFSARELGRTLVKLALLSRQPLRSVAERSCTRALCGRTLFCCGYFAGGFARRLLLHSCVKGSPLWASAFLPDD